MYVQTLMFGRHDTQTAACELDAIEREEPGRYVAAQIDLARGELARLGGRYAEGRRLMRRAMERFRELGLPTLANACEQVLARAEFSEGDLAAALVTLRRGDAGLAEVGERGYRSTTQAFLAVVHERLGDHDAARGAIELSDRLGAAEDVGNYAITHAVRARLALADGDMDAAERWARSSVDHACLRDDPIPQAEAKLALARVLAALDRQEEAGLEARAALRLFTAKGDRPGASQAQALVEELGARA
jgi:hypothetical protein